MSHGAYTSSPAAKLTTVITSCAWPKSCPIRLVRPAACRRARSRRSCNSLSSKSSRSSVAACSISRRLVSLLKRSDSSESSSETTRPSTSDATASPNSSASSQPMRSSAPLAIQSRSVSCADGAPASSTTSSMISLPTYSVTTGSRARTIRSRPWLSVSARLVCQTSFRNGGRLRSAPRRARRGCGGGGCGWSPERAAETRPPIA